jgi:hypothetical protein
MRLEFTQKSIQNAPTNFFELLAHRASHASLGDHFLFRRNGRVSVRHNSSMQETSLLIVSIATYCKKNFIVLQFTDCLDRSLVNSNIERVFNCDFDSCMVQNVYPLFGKTAGDILSETQVSFETDWCWPLDSDHIVELSDAHNPERATFSHAEQRRFLQAVVLHNVCYTCGDREYDLQPCETCGYDTCVSCTNIAGTKLVCDHCLDVI